MKPRFPLTQSYEQLPDTLPLYPLENALLPGGELPLELAQPQDLALFISALRSDQLIGMVQPHQGDKGIYSTGCAGRIRQYRERNDGRLNIMLTGVCRYRIVDTAETDAGFMTATVDWTGFADDYVTEDVDKPMIDDFMSHLRHYFDSHNMKVDWKVLNELPIEQVVNNLVLIINLDIASKQQLLESATVAQRLQLFSSILDSQPEPILAAAPSGVN